MLKCFAILCLIKISPLITWGFKNIKKNDKIKFNLFYSIIFVRNIFKSRYKWVTYKKEPNDLQVQVRTALLAQQNLDTYGTYKS